MHNKETYLKRSKRQLNGIKTSTKPNKHLKPVLSHLNIFSKYIIGHRISFRHEPTFRSSGNNVHKVLVILRHLQQTFVKFTKILKN
jgi:hypothetical protein